MHDALDRRLAELLEPGKFAQLGTPFSRHVIGHHAVVTVEVRHLTILERIAAQLSVQLLGDHINADSGRAPAGNLAAFIDIDLGVGALHVSFLARINRCYLLQVALHP
ncbi:hypothetical protein HFO53_12075 [Rhizobium laguerreae]|nr:hypothetical protein [Rhizobium laguerreae]